MRLKIIGHEMIKNVGKSESCMVSKVPIIFKRTRSLDTALIDRCMIRVVVVVTWQMEIDRQRLREEEAATTSGDLLCLSHTRAHTHTH